MLLVFLRYLSFCSQKPAVPHFIISILIMARAVEVVGPISPPPWFSVVFDMAGPLIQSFGTAGLLLSLSLDAWRSKAKKTHWIPSNSLVLGAVSLQLVALFYRQGNGWLSVYDIMLLNRGGRVVVCVFFGILLSDVARSRDRNVLSDMLAFSISATAVLIHLSYEIYALYLLSYANTYEYTYNLFIPTSRYISWMLISNIIIFASIVLLILLLGCAVLASQSIQELVTRRIPVLLSRTGYRNPPSVVLWEAVETYAVRSWITARTHQPQYIIARSVLSSSIGFLVTVCVAVSVGDLHWNRYNFHTTDETQGLHWLRVMAITLQWIFILLGWAIVCCRWLTAVVYFPRVIGVKGLGLRAYFPVEEFWKTAIVERQEELMGLDRESVKEFSYARRFLFMLFNKLRLYKLLPTLLPLQIFLVLLSKTCWLISEMLFSNYYMRRLLMGRAGEGKFSKVYNHNRHDSGGATGPRNPVDFLKYSDVLMHMPQENPARPGNPVVEFLKYSDVLMHMPEENPAGVWIANQKSIQEIKSRFEKGEEDGKNCKALISLLERTARGNLSSTDSFVVSLGDFNVGKSSSKMMVVSLLTIVIQLSAFYQDSGGSSAGPPTDTVNDCLQACCEAWKIMELVGSSDPETVMVNKQADKLLDGLKESRNWLGRVLPTHNFEARTVEAAKGALQVLADIGKGKTKTAYESQNWKTVIAGNSLYKLCERVKDHSVNVEEVLDGVQNSLADVIRSCMFKMGEIIIDECRLWAEAFMEEKLWDAFYEVGRAKGITQQLQPRIKLGRKLDRLRSF